MPIILESPAASGGGGSGTVTNVSSTNTGIAVANPTTTPTLTLATLDVIAADGPPAANWSNNAKKITSLAVASAATDAASLANTLDQFAAPAADVAMGSHKLTGLSNATAQTDAAAFGQIPTSWRHKELAQAGTAISETFPIHIALTNGAPPASGQALFSALYLETGTVVTSITFLTANTALATGTHQIFGLYNNASPPALLRGTSDDTNTAWAANTLKTLNLTSTFTTTYSGLYYVCCLVTAGTLPTLVRAGPIGAGGQAVTPLWGAAGTTTALTALENPSSTLLVQASVIWGYVT
jgi:hypothetical protein